MRKIELKNINGFDYKQVLSGIISSPQDRNAGMHLDEIRRAIKILDLIEASDGVLVLEETDWKYVQDRVKSAPYVIADKRIIEFADTVIGATEIKVQEKPA